MNRYTVSSLIGEGSFGRVYKATRKDDDQVVAIKIISKRGRSKRELKNLVRECDIQAKLKHSNIIEMFESFETKNDLVVVTEFALTDLHKYLSRNGVLTEERAQRLICHLVSALYYLHSNRILHRDLKPQNVLLNESLHAKLCDFGLARNMTVGTHVLTSIKGTPLYMAPELLAEKPYDHQADLWSLGCISYESMAGQPPFCTTSILHLVKLIKHEEVKWPSFLSSDCRSFLQGLLEKDPSMRISWAQILCHPFVEGKLLISCIKADNAPFINPQRDKKGKKSSKETEAISALVDNLSLSRANDASESTNDNMTTSRDSINAIPPSDIENLETDIDDNQVEVPFADRSLADGEFAHAAQHRPNLVALAAAAAATAPVVNSQTCFVSGNTNMILNHMNDNFAMPSMDPSEVVAKNIVARESKASMKISRSKELEKRKLSQNLENFSLRLGHNVEVEGTQRKGKQEMEKDEKMEKKESAITATTSPMGNVKTSTQSTDGKQSSTNISPPCLLPGWDSCDESQSPPIENDEWLAFLNRTIQEVMDGELDSLKQHNLVSIIVAPLRNSKAIPQVIDSVAQLLSLPFVLGEPTSVVDLIETVYVDVKLVPNLMYASKLLLYQKSNSTSDSAASITPQPMANLGNNRPLRSIGELSSEEIRTASRLYELICHLVHLKQQFLMQFCDAVAILAADEILITFLNNDFKNSNAVRICCNILALFSSVLRELPENADLVEKTIFSSKLNLLELIQCKNDLLKMRVCMLFRLLARFSLRGLQSVWSPGLREAFESLADDRNVEVREEAEGTLEELKHFSFYA